MGHRDVGRIAEGDFNLNYLIRTTINGTGDSDAHLMTLFSIVLSIKAKTIIELGVRGGRTTVPFLLAAKKLNSTLHSVDTKPHDLRVPDDFQAYWKFYQMDAVKFLEDWDKNIIPEIIYVDDLHSYKHVAKELSIIESMVDPNSIVLLHDTMYYNTQPQYHIDMRTDKPQWIGGGPARAVLELDKETWEWSTIPCCNGLTILRKKGGITQHYYNTKGILV